MILKVLQKQMEYKGCPVVIRQGGETFEYITCVNNEIYSSYIIAKKSLLRKVFFMNYSKKQMHKITNYMIGMAQTTIETILSESSPIKNKKK